MKHLILAGLLAMPASALVACQANNESVVDPATTSVMTLEVSGMT